MRHNTWDSAQLFVRSFHNGVHSGGLNMETENGRLEKEISALEIPEIQLRTSWVEFYNQKTQQTKENFILYILYRIFVVSR